MTNRYSQRGSLTIGDNKFISTGIMWPFGILTATEDGIMLKVLWIRYEISKSSISTVGQRKSLFLRGIQILHTNNSYPQILIFWSFNNKKLLSELHRLGYPIDNTS